jgi:ABC transporter
VTAARALDLTLAVTHPATPQDIDKAFDSLTEHRVGALLLGADALYGGRIKQLVSLAARHKMSDPKTARERALESLDVVDLLEKRNHFARELSTGQRKWLELARGLAMSPWLILMDEVTGGVDQPAIAAAHPPRSPLRSSPRASPCPAPGWRDLRRHRRGARSLAGARSADRPQGRAVGQRSALA